MISTTSFALNESHLSDKIRVYPRTNVSKTASSRTLKKFCTHSEADEVIHETHESRTQLMFVSCRFVCLVDKSVNA